MSNASVPAERLEALAASAEKAGMSIYGLEWDGVKLAKELREIVAILAEAREEGKPIPEISEAQLYEAVRHKSIKDRMDAVSALFARVAPPASAGTEGPIERVARALARSYWQGRGETITREQEDEFWLSWGRDAEAALARVEGEKK